MNSAFECINRTSGNTIRGQIYYPENADGKYTAVILSHGFMGDCSGHLHHAQWLSENGFIGVAYDFCGGGNGSKSDGKSTDMTVLTEVTDLETVMEYVKNLENVSDIILAGFSQGGLVSALTAAKHGDEVKKLMLFYPALCIPDDMRARYDINNLADRIPYGDFIISGKYPAAIYDMDPFEIIPEYKGNVLIIHGDADGIVNVSYAHKALKAYGEDRCRLIVIPGAGHGFWGETDKETFDYFLDFIKE